MYRLHSSQINSYKYESAVQKLGFIKYVVTDVQMLSFLQKYFSGKSVARCHVPSLLSLILD